MHAKDIVLPIGIWIPIKNGRQWRPFLRILRRSFLLSVSSSILRDKPVHVLNLHGPVIVIPLDHIATGFLN